ncbi:hypothetical protein LEP1GSC016_0002 [Leptospira borgpetersenii serovar Hardjo-bovis str. Sponselee]|uniref:Uncharacterized protein n=1 Tax=Leptospira borgpetersenii serovar Hardjo-bovis str. Sponselee TaxID=1303729 RepID=M6BY41_LEPBO|nr:hypothetical protein LBK6_09775 [Leptospira borgpetersenii serovar Hardjo]AMX61865.1 hypothetical protein LBK9_09795 [Leptospira borgpetersenii serovar Hardjo]AMX65109.1 hypothetical protein LBK30_09835 [Leptospira borgpetersenii serovar Hardjo]AMX68319.1 hypothetical protein LBHA_09670 [Leptospira borgpetersenii serovar Hardjo]EMJ78780.1 hypothetical protein LEP1GSC016_0002 [Leptospira borgpetersenii serovar Hardjo-bovis str. Sponselee]
MNTFESLESKCPFFFHLRNKIRKFESSNARFCRLLFRTFRFFSSTLFRKRAIGNLEIYRSQLVSKE